MNWLVFLIFWGVVIAVAIALFYTQPWFRKLVQDSEVTLMAFIKAAFAASVTLLAGLDPTDFQQQVRDFIAQTDFKDWWMQAMIGTAILLWIARWIRDKFFVNLVK